LHGGGIGNGRIAKANQEALKKAIISGVGKPWNMAIHLHTKEVRRPESN